MKTALASATPNKSIERMSATLKNAMIVAIAMIAMIALILIIWLLLILLFL